MSVCSYSSDGSSSSGSVAVPNHSPVPVNNETNVCVDNMVVQNGGTGILHGIQNNVHVTLLLSKDEVDTVNPSQLVSDAIKITSESNKTFNPYGCDSTFKVNGYKDDAEKLGKRWYYLIISLVILAFVTLLGTAVLSLTSWRSRDDVGGVTVPSSTSLEEALIANTPGGPRIVTRSSWLAAPPVGLYDNNILPVLMVVVCHTATENCYTTPDCIARVRSIQNFHQRSQGWEDIGYNFLIGGDGEVYWGRGFENMGAHTKGYNNRTIGVAFIGTFIEEMPTDNQILAFHQLIEVGVKKGKISEDYILVAQCQLQITAAPGLMLVTNMTSWSHFNSSLPISCTDA